MKLKIDRVEMTIISMPLVSPFETSFGREIFREAIILQLFSEGLMGLGECAVMHSPGYSYETTGTAWHILEEFFIPRILSRPIETGKKFPSELSGYKGHPLARAGLEMALWDLEGKSQEKSLRQLFGGKKTSVKVGVSIGIQEKPASLLANITDYLEEGYSRIKIKIAPGRDMQFLSAVRKEFPDIQLQVDANSAYGIEDADLFRSMDSLRLDLIEQPLAEDDLFEHSLLQAKLKTPLCLDESILSQRHARSAIEMDACKIINIKPGRVGGLAEGLAIHDWCYEREVPVWCGGMLETGIGRASNLAIASLPGFKLPGDISGSDRYYAEDLAEPLFHLNPDSSIDVPQGPGLGVTLLNDRLKKFTIRTEHYPA
jgi:o-succinylbenzoate synthase